MSQWPGGWTGDMVGTDPSYLPAFEVAGVIVPVRDENGCMEAIPKELATGYRLSSFGNTYRCPSSVVDQEVSRSVDPPEDLFDSLVGYNDVKEFLLVSLGATKPVHLLMVCPPALAKSLFRWEIEQAYAADTLWLLGSAASKPCQWVLITERRPQVLCWMSLKKMPAWGGPRYNDAWT